MSRLLYRFGFVCTIWTMPVEQTALGQHQTLELTPVLVGQPLSFDLSIEQVTFPADRVPGLHSMVSGESNGEWIFMAGRSNGLHDLFSFGLASFPPRFQNRDVWVINPTTQQVWHRSLDTPDSGLSTVEVDSITPSNAQAFQRGDRLYMTGGYGFDRTSNRFLTYDRLSAIDLPELVDWVKGISPGGTAGDAIEQVSSDVFRVTGGEMAEIDGVAHLVFGQNFDGPYNPFTSGEYTNQVRSFEILDDENGLRVENVRHSESNDAFHRRDLNVLPTIARGEQGELQEGLLALSGVFTPSDGAWTIPVEIDSAGLPTMADPGSANVFRQGMNNYTSAAISAFSEKGGEMHSILLGGISLQYYDPASEAIVTDDALPFINQITDVIRDGDGVFRQYLLEEQFPELFDGDGQQLRFGTNAEFMLFPELDAYGNGVIDLDSLVGPTVIGHVFGGIASNAGNGGASVASNVIFRVVLTPAQVPEPASWLLAALCIPVLLMRQRCLA